jgi:hypothetical protein
MLLLAPALHYDCYHSSSINDLTIKHPRQHTFPLHHRLELNIVHFGALFGTLTLTLFTFIEHSAIRQIF